MVPSQPGRHIFQVTTKSPDPSKGEPSCAALGCLVGCKTWPSPRLKTLARGAGIGRENSRAAVGREACLDKRDGENHALLSTRLSPAQRKPRAQVRKRGCDFLCRAGQAGQHLPGVPVFASPRSRWNCVDSCSREFVQVAVRKPTSPTPRNVVQLGPPPGCPWGWGLRAHGLQPSPLTRLVAAAAATGADAAGAARAVFSRAVNQAEPGRLPRGTSGDRGGAWRGWDTGAAPGDARL